MKTKVNEVLPFKEERAEEKKRDAFVFYRSFYEAVQSLPDKDRLAVYEAIFAYSFDGEEPLLFGVPATVFRLVKPTLDASKRKAASGKAGGEANRKQSAGKPKANGKQTQSKAKAIRTKDKGQGMKDETQGMKDETQGIRESPAGDTKKIAYAEFVRMTEEEYGRLLSGHGEEKTKRAIEILDNYKGSNGKTYKSDYRAILNWVIDRVNEEFGKRGGDAHERDAFKDPAGFTPSTGFGGL